MVKGIGGHADPQRRKHMKLPQPIQYQDSKRLLAPLILRYVPEDAGPLVEPFSGTGALSIAVVLSNGIANRRQFMTESRGELSLP